MPTTYTYGNDPVISATATAAQKRDAVRFLVQDNQADASSQFQLTDEEIAFLVAQEANLYRAAAAAAETLANRTGAVSSKSVGALSLTWTPAMYRDLAKHLRARGNAHQKPYVGGISKDDKDAHREDEDAVQPAFTRDLHETPGTVKPTAALSET